MRLNKYWIKCEILFSRYDTSTSNSHLFSTIGNFVTDIWLIIINRTNSRRKWKFFTNSNEYKINFDEDKNEEDYRNIKAYPNRWTNSNKNRISIDSFLCEWFIYWSVTKFNQISIILLNICTRIASKRLSLHRE